MFNPADLNPPPGPDRRCRYVKVNGFRCRLRAKPNSDLCVDHHFKKTYSRGRVRPSPPATFNTVPLVRFAWAEDHDSILFNCNQIALALVHDTISARHAGALNALMHTAQRSLRQKFLHERLEARERERAAGTGVSPVGPPSAESNAEQPIPEDIVTDYVLDTDGMPLALPDNPGTETPGPDPGAPGPDPCSPRPETPGTPSLSSPAPGDDSAGGEDPSRVPHVCPPLADMGSHEPHPRPHDSFAEYRRPLSLEEQRENILFLREYYKNDPKMLAEIEARPAARLCPKPKVEPEAEIVILPTLTAAADPSSAPPPIEEKLVIPSRAHQGPAAPAPGAVGKRSEGPAVILPTLTAAADPTCSRPSCAAQRHHGESHGLQPVETAPPKKRALAPDLQDTANPCPLYQLPATPVPATHSSTGPNEVPCLPHIAKKRAKFLRPVIPEERRSKSEAAAMGFVAAEVRKSPQAQETPIGTTKDRGRGTKL